MKASMSLDKPFSALDIILNLQLFPSLYSFDFWHFNNLKMNTFLHHEMVQFDNHVFINSTRLEHTKRRKKIFKIFPFFLSFNRLTSASCWLSWKPVNSDNVYKILNLESFKNYLKKSLEISCLLEMKNSFFVGKKYLTLFSLLFSAFFISTIFMLH